MKLIDHDEGGRYLSISLNTIKKTFILHCVYFTYFSTNMKYIAELSNLICKIEINFANFASAFHV